MATASEPTPRPSMCGVLVDVSGSMESAYDLDASRDAKVERIHTILTTIINIVNKEVAHHGREDSIFVSAFGLCKAAGTCDLIGLLDLIAGPADMRGRKGGHEALIELAHRRQAPHFDEWIRKHLSKSEAEDLYRVLCIDQTLIPEIIELIPPKQTTNRVATGKTALNATAVVLGTGLGFAVPGLGLVLGPALGLAVGLGGGHIAEKGAVHNSEAYQFAQKLIRDKDDIINRTLQRIQYPKPRGVQYVSDLLESLNLSKKSSTKTLHEEIREQIDPIKPYIFGGTPMCQAMNDAVAVFRNAEEQSKVLFILSDGQSADGDPLPIAQRLQGMGVTIVTCYLTADYIDNPKCLLDKADPTWLTKDGRSKDGKSTMFEMSSTMRNTVTPVSYLVDADWELPPSGESRLFVQANSLDVVNEICETVVSQMANPCDTMVDILAKVPLATYINQRNDEFTPKRQDGGTCYANAIAAVFHLAMNRIVGRDGGVPDFYLIRDRLIKEYGKDGASTIGVLEKVCPEYRLHYQQVDETNAREALNKRRPVVATFSLYEDQWTKFSAFYKKSPKGILQRSDVEGESCFT